MEEFCRPWPTTRPAIDAPLASLSETDARFAEILENDSNAVALKKQLHSSSHNATCFKYDAGATGQCRLRLLSERFCRNNMS